MLHSSRIDPYPSQIRACAINAHGSSMVPSSAWLIRHCYQAWCVALTDKSTPVCRPYLPLSGGQVFLAWAIPLSPPFLGGHYPTSSVLRGDPTPGTPFWRPCFSGLVHHTPTSGGRGNRASRVPAESVYSMPGSSTPGMPHPTRLTAWRSVAFRVHELVGHSRCAFRGSITFRPAA